ncbi:hypothetical protein BT69DRAFT_1201374, partial [Atractiella rhizophila]
QIPLLFNPSQKPQDITDSTLPPGLVWISKSIFIIELQGKLEFSSSSSTQIGKLDFSNEAAPTLTIGSHLLRGKVVNLQKPFALLKKQKIEDDKPALEVVCLIEKKILFSRRPEPI